MKRYLRFLLAIFFVLIITPAFAGTEYGCEGSYTLKIGERVTLRRTIGHLPSNWTRVTWTIGYSGKSVKIISQNYDTCTIEAEAECSNVSVYCLMYYEGDLSTLYYDITVKSDSKLSVSATPSGGTISPGEKVTLSSNSSGAIIYYTLDGSTPTTNSSVYTTAGITINNDCTLKAIATKSGYLNSDVLSATYTVSPYEKYSVGDIFTAKSEEGIELSFRVTGIVPKTCEMYWLSPGFESSGKVTIPSSVNGYAVTNISVNAFVGWKNIDTVVIPNSVEIISNNAFTGCSLSSIVIPSSVTNIGNRAFENCDRLMAVVIPNSVVNLGEREHFSIVTI